MKKVKKAAKIEKVFGNSSKEEQVFDEKISQEENDDVLVNEDENIEEQSQNNKPQLSQKQIQKKSEIESVKSKISKILKSSNIEIIDENFGDEYELDETDSQKQSQQDYDTLKAMFGDKDRNKKDDNSEAYCKRDYGNAEVKV